MRLYRPVQPPKLQQELQHPGYSYREYARVLAWRRMSPVIGPLTLSRAAGSQVHRIIPDGCVDIIFDRRSASSRKAAFIAGLMTRFEALQLSEAQSLFGIRFYSEFAHVFLHNPVSAFLGEHAFLEDIWGNEGVLLADEILASGSAADMIEIIERSLNAAVSVGGSPAPSLLLAGMQYMYAYRGILSTAELADKLSFSERHVRRTFVREFGVGPKEMLGIVRFQSLLQAMYQGTRSSWTDLAMEYGYCDQSHFIKSFKRYYGELPGQILKPN